MNSTIDVVDLYLKYSYLFSPKAQMILSTAAGSAMAGIRCFAFLLPKGSDELPVVEKLALIVNDLAEKGFILYPFLKLSSVELQITMPYTENIIFSYLILSEAGTEYASKNYPNTFLPGVELL